MIALRHEGGGYAYPDGISALQGIDLDVGEGERVAVVGSNGAGKSTLLELLAGFRTPFTGRGEIFGEALTKDNAPRLRRRLGLIFQDPDDQVFMPRVWDDVAFGPKNLRWPPERVQAAVERALRDLEIDDLRERAPHRLSHGQKRRVALAGVLAMDPEILLLDEPTTGLDSRMRSRMLEKLSSLSKTMLVTTHHVEDFAEFVDRIVVLQGRVVASGRPRDVLLRDDLLEGAGLEPPSLPRLFRALQARGYPVDRIPLTVEEAVDLLVHAAAPSRAGARAAGLVEATSWTEPTRSP